MKVIDMVQCLGISYHFESEIEEILQDMHNSPPYYNDKKADDLGTIALWFLLFRQQGYNISCDIFEQFREHKGNFKVSLIQDTLGMLNLYEAVHLRIHGEDILDQALEFTTFYLKSTLSDMSPNLKEKVTPALNCPFHKVWWKKMEFRSTVTYYRERAVESYFSSLGMTSFEPQYKTGREIGAKLVALITIRDDTYDAYGTAEELEPFTEAIQRCDISLIDSFPKGMKVACQAMLDLFKEIELLIAENGTSCYVPYVILVGNCILTQNLLV
ncbi:hypothetical protein L6164_028494 [Bauhinia variegata]|uniref:Uncharacterized protein n=2 Tax=Bauhinia variegata TaxID=167791 RepID=A0ACB9L6N5_BAUVA|nr:hypothetical protein L6164_028494 [Bauhinia variegata]